MTRSNPRSAAAAGAIYLFLMAPASLGTFGGGKNKNPPRVGGGQRGVKHQGGPGRLLLPGTLLMAV